MKCLYNLFLLSVLVCGFHVKAQPPTIASFSPTSGPIGTSVTITGNGFEPTVLNNVVYFGQTRATVTSATSTSLVAIVPIGASYAPITVTIGGLQAYSKLPFNVTYSSANNFDNTSLSPRVNIPTGGSATQLAFGDLNGDGKVDMVVSNGTTVSVFKNISASGSITTASFEAAVNLGNESPFGVIVNDIDGDGKLDIATVNPGANTISIFRNISNDWTITTLSFAPIVNINTGPVPYQLAAGDIDGDGRIDLISTNRGDNTVSIIRNIGSPGNISPSSFDAKVDLAGGSQPLGVAVADFNGDSKNDLVVANLLGASLSIFENVGSPGNITLSSFASRVDLATSARPTYLAIADFDGDGKQDIAVDMETAGALAIVQNISTGGAITTGSFAAPVEINSGANPDGIAIADMNADGKPDVAMSNFSGNTVNVFINTSTGATLTTGSFSPVTFSTGSQPYGVGIQDLDWDGLPDLVVAEAGSNAVSIYRNAFLITITKQSQTISFSAPAPAAYPVAPISLQATTTSGMPVSYSSSNPSVAAVSGNLLTIMGVGSSVITAAQPGNILFNLAASVMHTLTIAKGNQTISFNSLPAKEVGDLAFYLEAASSSGLPVTYASSNANVALITGDMVRIVGPGTTTITTSQSGDDFFNSAPDASQLLTIGTSTARMFGVTTTGGPFGNGTVYSMKPDGSAFQNIYDFGQSGWYPEGSLEMGSDGFIYGSTQYSAGGTQNGTLFKFRPDFSEYYHLKEFGGGDGRSPQSIAVNKNDGYIYGNTFEGGASNQGTIFKIRKDGTGFIVLHDFGWNSAGRMMIASDGFIYGVTQGGGANNLGVLYSIKTDGTGFTIIKSFSLADGTLPTATLTEISRGVLAGTCYAGGQNNAGTVFKINTDGGHFKILKHLSSTDGVNMQSQLLLKNDYLYGGTYSGGPVGNEGSLFKVKIDGTDFSVIHDFDHNNGSYFIGDLVLGNDGRLYGGTFYGGNLSAVGGNGGGVLFAINDDGSGFQVIRQFVDADGAGLKRRPVVLANGKLVFHTYYFGSNSGGSLASINSDGSGFKKLHDLGGAPVGKNPEGRLTKLPNGKLVGVAVNGGYGYGSLFSIEQDGSEVKALHQFVYTDGSYPMRGMTLASDGKLYGTTQISEPGYGGVLYSINPDGSGFTVLLNLPASYSGEKGIPVELPNQKIIFTTLYGGASNAGSLLSYSINDGGSFTTLYDYAGTPGYYPFNTPSLMSDGRLYGLTSQGGANNGGVIYQLNLNGSGYTTIRDFNGTTGAYPYDQLMEGFDGLLYGTTAGSPHGIIFKIQRNGSGFQVLKSFDNTDGYGPYVRLAQATDGSLYGYNKDGGSNNLGNIFKIETAGSNYSVLKNLDSFSGANPKHGELLFVSPEIQSQTITFNALPTFAFGAPPITLTATASSGMPVVYSSSNPAVASIEGSKLIIKKPGASIITAKQNGNYAYGAATPIDQTLTVNKADHIITFNSLPVKESGDLPFYLDGITSSGQPVSYNSDNINVAITEGDRLRIVAPGSATITALHAGNDFYNAATSVAHILTVNDGGERIYGLTSQGGRGGLGTAYSIKQDGSAHQVLYDFSQMGQYNSSLQLASDGFVYGTTSYDGAGAVTGTLFKMRPDFSEYYLLKVFNSTDGLIPNSIDVSGNDGYLYGATNSGGANNFGVIFKIKKDGTAFLKLHDFTSTNDEGKIILGTDGVIYGASPTGGTDNYGIIYKINTDGSGFTILHDLDLNEGITPSGGLVEIEPGVLAGTSYLGGQNNLGTVFRLNRDGTDFIVLYHFRGSDGAKPLCELIADDEFIYGTTPEGGTSNNGTVFKLRLDGHIHEVIHHFNGTDGSYPNSGLSVGVDGRLYGGTFYGGNYGITSGGGTLYGLDKNGFNYAVLRELTNADGYRNSTAPVVLPNATLLYTPSYNDVYGGGSVVTIKINGTGFINHGYFGSAPVGKNPEGTLTKLPDGRLAGGAINGGKFNYGNIFTVAPDGSETKLFYAFGYSDGATPAGVVVGSDNKLYGITRTGGTYNTGVIFNMNLNGTGYNKITDFESGSNSNWYGSLPVETSPGVWLGSASYNGVNNMGYLWRYNVSLNQYTKFLDLDGTIGSNPIGNLMLASDGKVYGVCGVGGVGFGTVFSFNPGGLDYQKLHDFDGTSSANPSEGLLEGADGKIYGTAPNGNNGFGVVYNLNKDGSAFTILKYGSSPLGYQQFSQPVQMADGNIYSHSRLGGANDKGTIFKLQPNGTNYTVVHSFNGTEGNDPVKGRLLTHHYNPQPQTITFDPIPNLTFGDAPYALLATSSSGAPVTYTSSDPSIVVVDGTQLIAKKAGTATITAFQNGNYAYLASPNVAQSVTVNKANQTITFSAPGQHFLCEAPFRISAETSADGAPIILTSGSPSVASVAGNRIYIHSLGTVSITASQPGNDYYNPATPVSHDLVVSELTGERMIGYTTSGGESEYGTMFNVGNDGSNFITTHHFAKESNGGNFDQKLIQGSTGEFFGVSSGGNYNRGVVYKLSADGATYTKLHDFDRFEGIGPIGPLVEYNGFLFGVAGGGGTNGLGMIYKMSLDGTYFRKLHDCNLADGQSPNSGLISDGAGGLYGTLYGGGANNYGVVFKINADGSGYSKLREFAGGTDGSYPFNLLIGKDGILYGMTISGGSSGHGTIFKVSKDGNVYTRIFDFEVNSSGSLPNGGSLIQTPSGKLIGAAYYGGGSFFNQFYYNGQDGSCSYNSYFSQATGTIFSLNMDGSNLVKHTTFYNYYNDPNCTPNNTTQYTNGSSPRDLFLSKNGKVYGVYTAPNVTSITNGDIIFTRKLFSMNQDGSGFTNHPIPSNIYSFPISVEVGTELIASSGSTTFYKFGYAPSSAFSYQTFHQAMPNISSAPNPSGDLLKVGDWVYGLSFTGTNNFGLIFKIKLNGTEYQVVHQFNNNTADGFIPESLIQVSDGKLYGITRVGGATNGGTLFRLDGDGTNFTKLYDFNGSGGGVANLQWNILEGVDGSLYGFSPGYGVNGNGSVFKINKDGSGFTIVKSFSTSETYYSPHITLTQLQDGSFLMYTYSAADGEDLIKMSEDGSTLTSLYHISSNSSFNPGITVGPDGFIYGSITNGGVNNIGGLYKVKPDGSDLNLFYSFSVADGYYPGILTIPGDGYVYFNARHGGANHPSGSILKVPADGSSATKLKDFTGGLDGRNPIYSRLILNTVKINQQITFNILNAKIYGDAAFNLSASSSSGLTVSYASDNVAVATVTGNTVTIVGAGTTNITASQAGTNLYHPATNVVQQLTVTKADLQATADVKSKVYGDANPTFSITYTGFKNTDVANVIDTPPTIATTCLVTSDVGTYPITLTGGVDNNYNITPLTAGILTVTQAPLIVTAEDKAREFGSANPSLTIAYSGFKGTDDPSVVNAPPSAATSATQTSNVGTYPITLSGGSDNNYSFGTLTSGTLTINQAALMATADNKSKEYGDANPALSLAYTGFKGTDDASVIDAPPTAATTAVQSSSVGAYPISLTGGVDNNYALSLIAGSLTINKAILVATADDKSKNYGDTNPTFTTSYTGFKGTDDSSVIDTPPSSSTTATQTSNVGTYPISLSGGTDNNYSLGTLTPGTLTINKTSVVVTANDKAKTYGDANPTLTITYTGLKGTDDSSVIDTSPTSSTTATQTSNVGTYPITLSGGTDNNYSFETSISGTLTINKAILIATSDDKAKIYGDSNPAFTINYTGFKGTDDSSVIDTPPSSSTTATQTSNVGTYPITLSGGTDNNYSFGTSTPGTLTINKAILVANADDKAKIYGDANPTFTINYTGFKGTDDSSVIDTPPSSSTTATQTSNVGTYPITLSGGVDNNYSFGTLSPGTLTIDKAILVATADDKSKIYGDANPTFTINYTGFKGTDNSSVIDTPPSSSTTATQTSNVGTYPITLSGGTDNNYSFGTSTSGTLTVAKAILIATADNKSKNYGDVNPSFTLAYSGFRGTDDSSVIDTPPSSFTTATQTSNVGTYPITLSGGVDNNYSFGTLSPGTLSINSANQTISFSTLGNKAMGDSPSALTAEASSGLEISYASTNTLVATVSGSTLTITGTGSTTITASQAGNSNYNAATDVQQALTVSKGNQTITFTTLPSKLVSDPAFTLSATSSSGLPISYSSSNTSVATVSGSTITIVATGSTNITASQAGNSNYNAAIDIAQPLTVSKISQTITFTSLLPKTIGDPAFTLSASASSELTITFSSSNTSVATVLGSKITIVGVGSTNITASQSGNLNYFAATDVTQTLTVSKITQTITFNELPSKIATDGDFVLNGTSSSGLPISYLSSNSAVATITGKTVTLVGAGTTTITASQAGDDIYNAAENVNQILSVTKSPQNINFNAISAKTLGELPFSLNASASSGLAVQYNTASDKVSISSSEVTLLKAGNVVINATQSGDIKYASAVSVSQAFCINPAKPIITVTGADADAPTITSSNDTGNQWFLDDVAIVGATDKVHTVREAGVYKVNVTIDDCVSDFSETETFIITGNELQSSGQQPLFYPNPSRDKLIIRLSGFEKSGKVNVLITDLLGRTLEDAQVNGGEEMIVDVSYYSNGPYIVQMNQNAKRIQKQFIKH